ncbi:YjcQ family protein [Romboutsia sp. 1001216sp1]|uniref:YjcQ family protein n=1 Tax=unclassified Romboutsia TaxID=2626894 RepID=UPI0018A9D6B5|nr:MULTISPECIES: YjcQ family protein [unclassified Romboutsia]MDB8794300.1 YjcQ family protein [Romboutsia sp. 1001216sp1]MDB8796469.1 YjcQ family protein [Romboutsia sp. 1001216sp1]MDB8797778.1 YjcQ family protein [Romboutsia sp. 1001216sp1]
MKLDTKQKVLIAIYTEYQKDIPEIHSEVRAEKLGIDEEAFDIAIVKLENEGLITDTYLNRTTISADSKNRWGIGSRLDDTKMTPWGIEYVETKLGLEKTMSGMEKVQEIAKKSATWGWNEFKDITVKVLSEMGKHGIDKILGSGE